MTARRATRTAQEHVLWLENTVGWSDSSIARSLGVSRTTVYSWAKGRTHPQNRERLAALLKLGARSQRPPGSRGRRGWKLPDPIPEPLRPLGMVDAQHAAVLLDLTPWTVAHACRDGRIRCYYVGKMEFILIPMHEIRRVKALIRPYRPTGRPANLTNQYRTKERS